MWIIPSDEANTETKWKNYFLQSKFHYSLSLGLNPFWVTLLGKGRKTSQITGGRGEMTKLNTEEHQILKKKKKNYIKQLRKNLRELDAGWESLRWSEWFSNHFPLAPTIYPVTGKVLILQSSN